MLPMIKAHKAYHSAPEIRLAEKSAGGTMPAGAFQYCEAMRSASAYGWYVYPPKDLSLLFDGREVFFHEEGQWFPIKSTNFEENFRSVWQAEVPDNIKEYDPPFISELFAPGAMQIWSGYFIETVPGWSTLVRPPVNYNISNSFFAYEGIVDTSTFKPWPLFINIQLLTTDREIFISKDRPLFQIQPIPATTYRTKSSQLEINDCFDNANSSIDWAGVYNTVRRIPEREQRRPGSYGADQRKKDKTKHS